MNKDCGRHDMMAAWLLSTTLIIVWLATFGLPASASQTATEQRESHIYNKVKGGDDKRNEDREKLGKAMEYFKSGKYHEAYLLYSYLDSLYTLSPRTKAFMGVSAYYDGDYTTAVDKLGDTVSAQEVYPSAEMSVYCYCCAESLFRLKQFARAQELYERYISLCKADERTEALIKIGQCHIEAGRWEQALEALDSAEQYSEAFDSGKYRREREQLIARLTDICRGGTGNGTIFANKSSTGTVVPQPKGSGTHESITETKKTDKK